MNRVINLVVLFLLTTHAIYAKDSTHEPVIGTIIIQSSDDAPPTKKRVSLIKVHLTPQQSALFVPPRQMMRSIVSNVSQHRLPTSINIGMKGVPVLNQGLNGTCSTFAVTGAIDALLQKGDYISQLCFLELGTYLEQHGHTISGWNYNNGAFVLSRLHEFGIVNKHKQQAKLCGGIAEYPIMGDELDIPLSVEEYLSMSEDINDIYWSSILTPVERFHWKQTSDADAEYTLLRIREALVNHNHGATSALVIIGAILPYTVCSMGACAHHHKPYDTWAITRYIANSEEYDLGGHDLIVTGYDDKATATDNEGHVHRGLLILRNSWGDDAGDNGNYYMTYDFFKSFVTEAYQIVHEGHSNPTCGNQHN